MAVIGAQHEPGETVDDVVQAGDDQDPIEHPIAEQSPGPGGDHRAAERIHAELEPLPFEPEGGRESERRNAAENGHEPPAAEEGEISGQVDPMEAVVERAAQQTAQDAGRDRQCLELVLLERLNGEVVSLPGQRRERGGRSDEHLRALGGDQIRHHGRKPGGAVILARESDRDTDREQQSEIVEDRLPGSLEDGQIQQVRLAEAKQQGCDRQYRDRQHQGAADPLQLREELFVKPHACSSPFGPARAGRNRSGQFCHGTPRHTGSGSLSCAAARTASARTASAGSAQAPGARSRCRLAESACGFAFNPGMTDGTADSSCTPSPMRMGAAAGSEARPPHTATMRWRACAACAVRAISRSTAGCSASRRAATRDVRDPSRACTG